MDVDGTDSFITWSQTTDSIIMGRGTVKELNPSYSSGSLQGRYSMSLFAILDVDAGAL